MKFHVSNAGCRPLLCSLRSIDAMCPTGTIMHHHVGQTLIRTGQKGERLPPSDLEIQGARKSTFMEAGDNASMWTYGRADPNQVVHMQLKTASKACCAGKLSTYKRVFKNEAIERLRQCCAALSSES
jgi:hypothetical protein